VKRRVTATRAILAVLLSVSAEAVGRACPICFQIDDGNTASGVRAAVGVLMGVTTVVLAGFAIFAARFIRREADQRHIGTSARRNPGTQ
jgi:hypothetical protein